MSKEKAMPPLQVSRLSANHITEAATLCVDGMQDNPLHKRIFGQQEATRRQRLGRFFPHLLHYTQRRGLLFGAFHGNTLVAIFGLLPPGQCRPAPVDVLRLIPAMVAGSSPLCIIRTIRWLWHWFRHDPAAPHWHLGPLVVAHHLQGHGIGRTLINHVRVRIKTQTPLAWLETDKEINVKLYQSYGFKVVATSQTLGVRNWFMQGSLNTKPGNQAKTTE